MPMIGMPELIILAILCLGPLALAAIALIIILVSRSGARKGCPYCAKRIRSEAVICQHCGRDLDTASQAKEVDGERGPAPAADSGETDA